MQQRNGGSKRIGKPDSKTPKGHKLTLRSKIGQKRFLRAMAEYGNISYACGRSGLNRTTVYRWREEFPDFRREWDEAVEVATDRLELALRKRATRRSDSLGMFFLKAKRPEYRERYEIDLKNDPRIKIIVETMAQIFLEFIPEEKRLDAFTKFKQLMAEYRIPGPAYEQGPTAEVLALTNGHVETP